MVPASERLASPSSLEVVALPYCVQGNAVVVSTAPVDGFMV